MLKLARTKSLHIVVQSVLPVQEELFPQQDWLNEDKRGFNADIEAFNKSITQLCKKYQIKYLDAYTNFCSSDLSDFYMDAVHLNKRGQSELAKIYKNKICDF